MKQTERVPSTFKLILGLAALVFLAVLLPSDYKPQNSSSSVSSLLRNINDDNNVRISSSNENHSATELQTRAASMTVPSPSSQQQASAPRLFTCGFDLWSLGTELFGDLEFVGRFGESSHKPKAQDILLQGGLNGPCHQSPEAEFPGKILFVNSEARTDNNLQLQDRFVQLGPVGNPHERALPKVTFGAIFFIASTTPEQRQWILDPTQRPHSGKPREAAVFVTNRCGGSRKQAAMDISSLVKIHQNPKCQRQKQLPNFEAIPKQDWTPRQAYRDNYLLYSKYKYCLVMENTHLDHYITEKLFLAFMGGCLPIYAGTPTVLELFHKDVFVYFDPEAPESALAELQRLQTNHTLYQEKMAQPILAHGMESANEYLSLAQDVGDGRLRSTIRNMLGIHTIDVKE